MNLSARLQEFKHTGFTVFERVHGSESMVAWKRKFDEIQREPPEEPTRQKWWLGGMLEREPDLMWPAVAHPEILEFAELVMGPLVQLDNLTLAGFPPDKDPKARGRVSGWHRDRWGNVPQGSAYVRPLAINAISYLQDLTDEFGPLRVIPGSHRKPLTLTSEERQQPHPYEQLFHLNAGDVVVIHNNLVHSGTANTSGQTRYFFSVYYNLTWLKTTDNHTGPNTQRLINEARKSNNHRILRLLGADDQLRARNNHGFLIEDEEMWRQWQEQDKES